jgi:hypothetical protein
MSHENEPVRGQMREATDDEKARMRAEGFPEEAIANARGLVFSVEVHQVTDAEYEAEMAAYADDDKAAGDAD